MQLRKPKLSMLYFFSRVFYPMSKNNPHLLSIDFESWIFSEKINKKNLSLAELRKLDNGYSLKALDYILKTLKKHNQKITIFLVFKLEEIYPGIIKIILSEGHEVGWHSHTHPIIKNKSILEKELDLSKDLIRKYNIKGFQAPTISFIKEGYPLLKKYGFLYSSSIYGNSNLIYKIDGIYEIPVSVSRTSFRPKKEEIKFPSDMRPWKIIKYGLPFGSSFFWGLFGKGFYTKMLSKSKGITLYNLFIHDWQLITPQSKAYKKDVSVLSNPIFFTFFLFYRKNVSDMFEHLLSNIKFGRFIDYVKEIK